MLNINKYIISKFLQPYTIIDKKIYSHISTSQILGYYLFNALCSASQNEINLLVGIFKFKDRPRFNKALILLKSYINCSHKYINNLHTLLQKFYENFTYEDIDLIINLISYNSRDYKTLKFLIDKKRILDVKFEIRKIHNLSVSLNRRFDNTLYVDYHIASRKFIYQALLFKKNHPSKSFLIRKIISDDSHSLGYSKYKKKLAFKLKNNSSFFKEFCSVIDKDKEVMSHTKLKYPQRHTINDIVTNLKGKPSHRSIHSLVNVFKNDQIYVYVRNYNMMFLDSTQSPEICAPPSW